MNTFAQIQLGIKGGVNASNFTGGTFDSIENNTLISYHVGGFVKFVLGGNFAIQPELLLSSQGAKLKYAGSEEDYKVTYLNIPIMAQYEFDGGFYIEAGPQFGFKIDESVPDSLGDFAKSSDAAICFGLGYHFKGGLGIGARYNVGVSKVGDFDSDKVKVDPDFHNGVLQVSLFWTLFNNSKKESKQ